MSNSAIAAPTPNAGGSRTVDEDAANTYAGTDASGEGATFGWVFDGAVVDGISVSFTFATPGAYSVSFWADDGLGNNVTDTITVTVNDLTAPTGSGTVPSSNNEDSAVSFSSAAISDNDPNFASTRRDYWTFTDGTAKNLSGTAPSYTFNTPGTYAITLTVMDAAGNMRTQAFSINILDITAPTANAGSAQTVNEDTVVTFNGGASTDNDPNFGTNGRYYWTFSDQGTARSLTGKTTTYTFATPGTYTVTLLVLDQAGNFASAQVVITVKDVTAPVAVITGGSPQSFNEDISKTLDASSSTDNDPAFGSTGNYTWTFTDGVARTLYGKTTTYTFATPGTFTITLTVKDAAANSATATSTFTVLDVTAPAASWTISTGLTFNEDAAQTLDATASTDNVGVVSYAWAISDTSGTVARTGSTTSYTWATPGTYSVSLTVTDGAGLTNVKTASVTVKDITAPTGSGSVPSTANEDVSVAFSAASVTDNDLTFASNRRDFWTFTDGTAKNLSGSSQAYIFATPGTFTITLLTMDLAGNRFTASFTLTIADVTPPVPTIGATSLAQSRQVFSSMTHSGTATDNVAVSTYGWAFTENAVSQNITGQNVTRTWSYTGTYTITYWARDAAGNVGITTTTFTVTPDITLPTVTLTAGPTIGDDQTAVTYTATVSDNNPACTTTCTYQWQVDAVTITSGTVAAGTISFTATLTAGRHTVTARVTDPASNVGSASRVIDVDQLIMVDTTWNGVTVQLNNNIRVVNGASFSIINSTVQNSTNALTYRISVPNGRLVIEGSTFVATSPTVGFIINAVRQALPSATTVLINSSTIGGLYDWITVLNGTLSIRDSTIQDVRGANLGAIYTVNSYTYLTNVVLNANTITTTNGIRAEWDSFVTVLLQREIILQNVAVNSTLTPIRTFGFQVTGTINVNIRDTTIRSGSAVATTRGIDQQFVSMTGVVANTFSNVNSQAVRGGGLYAVYQAFNGTFSYNVSDSNFSGSLSGNGTVIQLIDSSSNFAYAFNNVVTTANSLGGIVFRFANQTAGIGSRNLGSIVLRQVSSFNNTLDGVHFQQFNTRLNATVDILGSSLSLNKRHGLSIDQQQGNLSGVAWSITDSWLLSNTGNGVMYFWNIQRVNVSMNFLRTSVENNTLNGMNLTWFQGNSFEGATRGNFWLNLSQSKFNTNTRQGVGLMENNSYSNNIFSLNMLDSTMDFNKMNGFEMILNYAAQSYVWGPGIYYAPYADHFISLERSSFSNNVGNGVFTSAVYCAYGTTNSTFPSACLISFNISRSHVDNNNARGFFNYWYYIYYASQQGYYNIVNDSTVNNNGMAGINDYHYYTYMYNVGTGRQSETIMNIVNSTLNYNGRVSSAEGFGVYQYIYYDYYLPSGGRQIKTDNATFIGNKNSAIRPYVYYMYYGAPIYKPNIFNSTFLDNVGAAYDPYYYYAYQCGVCIQENVEQNIMMRNALGAIRVGLPQSAGRYFSSFSLRYVNNTIDQSPLVAISSYVTYAYTTYYYSGNNVLNISGNRISNVSGAAVSFNMDPPQTGGSVVVDFSYNYVNTTSDTSALFMPGSISVSHSWTVRGNTFINTSTSALVLNMVNYGSGNTGGLTFDSNTFRDTAGTAFSLVQSNIVMTGMSIRDCVFINSQIGLDLTGINGVVRNATFSGSIKADIQLTNGALEIHQTPVNPDLLVPIGAGSFSVYFNLKIYVVWSGSLRPASGSIVELSDALGTTFFVGSVLGAEGLPEFESLSYTKNAQGVLGRSPFHASVNYFELTQLETIPLPSDRIVNILLRDDIPPTMVLASPETGFATRGDTVQVEGTAYDSHSGFTYDQNDTNVAAQFVDISTDNTNWLKPEIIQASTGEIAFRLTLTGLDESVRNIYVRIHDEAGNYYTRIVPVVLDRTPPVVTLLEEVPAITRANLVHIVAETEVGTTVFVNGVAPPELLTRPDGIHVFFTMDVGIIEGPNTITVMAMDALRNQGRVTITVTADREAPYIVINSPEQDALVRGTDVLVKGHASDRNGVTVKLNGNDAALDADGNFSFPIPIAGDVTRIEAIATDGAGNQQILVRVVRFDEIPPWVTVESPAEGSLVGSTEVLVSGVVEQGATLVVNGETVDSPRGVFSRRILLVEGDNVIHVEATDSAGNKVSLDRPVTVDTRKPTITVTSFADNVLWSHSSIPLAGRVADDHDVTLTLDGANVDLTDGAFATQVELNEGTNVLHLIATDAAGNIARLDLKIVRDTTAPVVAPNVEGLVPDAGQYYTTQPAVSVTGIAEPGTIVEVCYTQEIGGRACNVVPLASDGSFRTFVDLQANTKNSITVRGTDAAGNVATRDFSISQSAPLAVEAQQPVAAYGLFIVALGILGLGGYFFLMSRRTRSRTEDLTEGDSYLAAPPSYEAPMAPHMDVAPAAVLPPAPAVEQPSISTVPKEEQLVDAAPVVEAQKPKMRPMRRRPVSGGEGSEGLSDKGTSAEGETGPTENQPEVRKEGEQ